MAKGKNVTGFVLDPAHVQASEDGMTVPPLPGLYRNDVAVLPGALGLTLAEMRDLVDKLSLPLVEVTVSEDDAVSEFPHPDYLLHSEPGGAALARVRGVESPVEDDVDETLGPEDLDVSQAEAAAAVEEEAQ